MNHEDIKALGKLLKEIYSNERIIPLNRPLFDDNDKKFLNECIDSTFVSSAGSFVDDFERRIADFTGASSVCAVINGSAALDVAFHLAGIKPGDEVITQSLSYVATANSILNARAYPVFLDVDRETFGLCPRSLIAFLDKKTCVNSSGERVNRESRRRINACVPVHTFGSACKIDEILDICQSFNITLIEDSAESLGTFYKGKHTGLYGRVGVLSFNGNKCITSGGGGAVISDNPDDKEYLRLLTTNARKKATWESIHLMQSFNYRMPNLNAALGCAQFEKLPKILDRKKIVHKKLKRFFKSFEKNGWYFNSFIGEPCNYWLNTAIAPDKKSAWEALEVLNEMGIQARPLWKLMTELEMFDHCERSILPVSEDYAARIIMLPSSADKI